MLSLSSARLINLFLLCASITLASASPLSSKERFDNRVARRAAGTHLSKPVQHVDHAVQAEGTGEKNVEYSSNWAGIVISKPAGTWRSVTGTIVVPTPKAPSGGSASTTYSASAWVGIDGDTCGTAILQTGIDFNVKGSAVSFDAWYEWYPDYAYDFSGISFSAGNTVNLTVVATSKTTGTATIANLSTAKSVTHTFTSSQGSLCEQDVEWIVEDFEEGSSLVPFANFGTVSWTNLCARTNANPSVCVTPSTSGYTPVIYDIEQGSTVLTSVSTSGSSASISYV